MRIGIITYWQSNDNYGQLLQCYALQKYLKDLGHEVFLIRYDFVNRKLPHQKWRKLAKAVLIYPVIRYIVNRRKQRALASQIAFLNAKNSERKFDEFRNQYIVSSKDIYKSLEELQQDPPIADAYVTGSDQVWSQLLNFKENETFYLNFGSNNVKRISYAASFALDTYPESLADKLYENLQRFDAISVREQTGVEICKRIGVNAELVVDPTLLLNSDVYRNLAEKKHQEKYVFIYSLNISSSEEMSYEAIQSYAQRENAKIIVTPSSGCLPGLELFEDATYEYATIPNWIANIDNSILTVTTSFHGIVFCLLLHTPFVYVPLSGALAKMNNRAKDLLKQVGLQCRILEGNMSFDDICRNEIDWIEVDEKLNAMRKKSYSFLKSLE